MADNQDVDTVVEDKGEDDTTQDFGSAEAKTTPETKPSNRTASDIPVVVDEEPEVSKKKATVPSVETTTEGEQAASDPEKSTEEPVKPVYKLKEENRIPQARFNQVVRQRKILESQNRQLQQEHLELLDFLEKFQAANPTVPLPKELVQRVSEKRTELQESRKKQYEARLDEAQEWLNMEQKKYVDSGFTFPTSFEREMIAIVQAENLQTLDPLETYNKAFSIWVDENIDKTETLLKTDPSNQSGKPEVPKASITDPKMVREEAKKKAMGVSKAKGNPSTPSKKEEPYRGYYAVDEDNTTW